MLNMSKEDCIIILETLSVQGLSKTEREALEFAINYIENDIYIDVFEDDMK